MRQDVIDEFDFEPGIDAADIGVTVAGGIAVISGHVPTYVQMFVAEQVAARVRGVKGIAQEIEVRRPGTRQTADDRIAKLAVDAIIWNSSIPECAVQVNVQKGRLTLTGKVSWQQRSAAADAVRAPEGVVSNIVIS